MAVKNMWWISTLTRSTILSPASTPPLPYPLKQLSGITNQTSRRRSMSSGEDGVLSESPKSNTHGAKLREIIGSNQDGWEQCWKEEVTPWDLGKTTPIISHLLQTGSLPNGRTLVPGCGSGHDVVAMAGPERYVVGLDISDTAVKKARELTSSLPNANHFTFLKEDFFNWHPSELFDFIYDYTFFCAIDPDKRPAWAKQISYLLKPDGELITLMFPIDDHEGGPPHKVSVADYEEVLKPVGLEAFYIEDNELAIEARKGREKLGRWKRSSKPSLL